MALHHAHPAPCRIRPMPHDLAILGAGNMAEAIARGVIRGNVFKPPQIIAADVAPARRELFTRDLGIKTVEANIEAARGARRVLLSVKPQQMGAVLAELGAVLDPNTL